MASGVDRLTERVRGLVEAEAEYDRPETIAECAVLIIDLERRVRELETFKNRPVVAIAGALGVALAAALTKWATGI